MPGQKRKKKPAQAQNSARIVRTADHRSHYVTGSIAQWTDDDLRLQLFNERIDGPGGPYFISPAQLIIPKGAVTRIADSLRRALRNEGKTTPSLVTQIPKDVTQVADKGKAPAKRKVPKIRRK